MGRGHWRVEGACDAADVVETGSQLVTRHHHAVRNAHRDARRLLPLEVQIAHLKHIGRSMSFAVLAMRVCVWVDGRMCVKGEETIRARNRLLRSPLITSESICARV